MDNDTTDNPMADSLSAETSSGTSRASSATATSLPTLFFQGIQHICRSIPGFNGCTDAACKARLEAMMAESKKRLELKQVTKADMDESMRTWLRDFSGWDAHIRNFFGWREVELFRQSTRDAWNAAVAIRDYKAKLAALEISNAEANGRYLPQPEVTWSMQLPLGKDLDNNHDWAIDKGERKHFQWVLRATRTQEWASLEFKNKVEEMVLKRDELDRLGIPTYVTTVYGNGDGRVVKDLQLFSGKFMLPADFHPRRVDSDTKNVIEAWHQGCAAKDHWRQHVLYTRRIRMYRDKPELASWNVVGPVRTSATMTILGQSVNQPPVSSYKSDPDLTLEDRSRDYSGKLYKMRDVAPQVVRTFDLKRKAILDREEDREEAEERAKKKAKREKEDAARVKQAEVQQEYENSFAGGYFARLRKCCKPKPVDQAYKTKISIYRLQKLQRDFPGGGTIQIRGESIIFPGIADGGE